MNNVQKELLHLLDAFAEACEASGIGWCAWDRFAWAAVKYHKFIDSTHDLTVLVKDSDASALQQALCALWPSGAQQGIALRRASDAQPTYRLVNKEVLHFSAFAFVREGMELGLTIRTVTRDEAGRYVAPCVLEEPVRFDADPTETDEFRLFEDRVVPVPADFEAFFTALEGPNWRTVDFSGPLGLDTFGWLTFQDSNAECLEDRLSALCWDIKDLEAFDAEYQAFVSSEVQPKNQAVACNNVMLNVNTQRMRLCQRYLPKKQLLLQQWRAGNKDAVATAISSDYGKELKRYYPKGVAVHFDDELFDLAVEVLRMEGWPHADELPALVPEAHRRNPLALRFAPYLTARH